MQLDKILQSNKTEHEWNTFGFGITAIKVGHQVKIFLMNECSEIDTISDTRDFDISVKVEQTKKLNGKIDKKEVKDKKKDLV